MLSRRFSPLTLLLLSINGMLGSAWLFAPLYAARMAGPASILAWFIGGVMTMVIALTFAELSVMFPLAGGTAQIPQLSHGTLTSFMMSWLAWLSALTMAPIEVQAILQYASTYFSRLMTLHAGVPVLSSLGFIWAILLMLSFCVINAVSFRGLVRFNNLLFFFKVGVIVLAVGLLAKTRFEPQNFGGMSASVTSLSGWQAILTAVATGGIAFAFTGFKHGVELAGEAKRVALAIPLALIGSVLCCLLLYVGLQVVLIGALNPASLRNGWQALSFVGDVGPFAGLAAGLGLAWLVKLLYVDAVVSPSGAGLIYVTSTARVLYAMSQIGFFDDKLFKAEDFDLWLRFLVKDKKMHNLQDKFVFYRTHPNDNTKRGHIHYKNYFAALKKHGKFIWPFYQRLTSLLLFFVVSNIPNSFLDYLLNLKIVKRIKNIQVH